MRRILALLLTVVMALSLVVVASATATGSAAGTAKLIVEGKLNDDKTVATYTIKLDTSSCDGVAALQFVLTPGSGMTQKESQLTDFKTEFNLDAVDANKKGSYGYTVSGDSGKYIAYGGDMISAAKRGLVQREEPYTIMTISFNVTDGRGSLSISEFIACKSGSQTMEERYTCEAPTVVSVGQLLGDVNGDGSVNMKDWIRLKNHLNKSDILTDLSGADVNGDGSVNMKDWIRLKNHLNKSDPLF